MQRISENQEKIEALGLSKLVTIFKDRITQKVKQKRGNKIRSPLVRSKLH